MKKFLALVVFALLTFTLSLVNVPQASADLKSVFTVVCRASDDIAVTHSGPSPTVFPVCSVSDGSTDCKALMVCMDDAKWHVIHDTRYPGAWFEFTSFFAGEARYKLLFQKD